MFQTSNTVSSINEVVTIAQNAGFASLTPSRRGSSLKSPKGKISSSIPATRKERLWRFSFRCSYGWSRNLKAEPW